MKKLLFILSLILIVAMQTSTQACVGRILSIGALGSTNEKILSELLAVIINERTGTTVTVQYFNDQTELYNAVKKGEISILVENTTRALEIIGEKDLADKEGVYKLVKKQYRKQLELVLLDPLGVTPAIGNLAALHYVPIITTEVLTDYPALPRVINKLFKISEDREYPKLINAVQSGKKPKGVAKKFLKKKRLI